MGRLVDENSLTKQTESVVEFDLFSNMEEDVKRDEAARQAEAKEKSCSTS